MTVAEITRSTGDHALSAAAGAAEVVMMVATAVVMVGVVVASQVVRAVLAWRD